MNDMETIRSMKEDLEKIDQDIDGMETEFSKIQTQMIKKVNEVFVSSKLVNKISWRLEATCLNSPSGNLISKSTYVPNELKKLFRLLPNQFSRIYLERNIFITCSSIKPFILCLHIYPHSRLGPIIKKYGFTIDLSIINATINQEEAFIKKLTSMKKEVEKYK